MKTQFTKLALTATFGFALAFTLSCSSDDKDDGGGGGGNSGNSNNGLYERSEYYKYYNPDDKSQRCQNGVVEEKCPGFQYKPPCYGTECPDPEGSWYNPITHYCERDWELYSEIVTSVKPWTCGKYVELDLYYRRCRDGAIERPDPEGDGWRPFSLCGSEYYDEWEEECQNGVIMRYCIGLGLYNTKTHYCDEGWDNSTMSHTGTIKEKLRCGNEYYNPKWQGCKNGVIGEKCPEKDSNGSWYNPITQYCDERWEPADPTNIMGGGTTTGAIKAKQRCGG